MCAMKSKIGYIMLYFKWDNKKIENKMINMSY